MAQISMTTDSIFRDILSDAVFVTRESALMPQLVTTFSAVGWARRDVPIWSQATSAKVPEGVDFATNTKLGKTVLASFTPEMAMAQFILTDQMQETDPDGARRAAAQELGSAIAEQVDRDLLGVAKTFTQSKGSAGSALTLATCAAALAVVRNNKGRGPASFVLHPYQWHDIWVQLGQPAATMAFLGDVANEALREYFVARQLGADWFITSNIDVDADDDATGAVFTRDALAIDIRKGFEMETERDASRNAVELNARMGYAVGKLRNERGVKIISDATEPA